MARLAVTLTAVVLACAATTTTALPPSSSHYTAAVVQVESVAAPSGDARETLLQNLATYGDLANEAAAKGAQIIVYPEWGAFADLESSACKSHTSSTQICEPYPAPTPAGSAGYASAVAPCDDPTSYADAPGLVAASCLTRNASLYASFNLCDRQPAGNYNAQLIIDPKGMLIAKYYKTHLWNTECFVALPTAQHVTFTTDFGVTFGVFTCKDILYSTPENDLVKEGIKHFVYSAAIPLIGHDAVQLWSGWHNTTVVYSNLQNGQSGIVEGGHLKAGASGKENQVVVFDVLK